MSREIKLNEQPVSSTKPKSSLIHFIVGVPLQSSQMWKEIINSEREAKRDCN